MSAAVEFCTGLVAILDPALVIRLLLGVAASDTDAALARFLGIALVCLGLACWPRRTEATEGRAAFRSLLPYNTLVAVYLAYLGAAAGHGGVLLWPAVALHAVVAMLLVLESRRRVIK